MKFVMGPIHLIVISCRSVGIYLIRVMGTTDTKLLECPRSLFSDDCRFGHEDYVETLSSSHSCLFVGSCIKGSIKFLERVRVRVLVQMLNLINTE